MNSANALLEKTQLALFNTSASRYHHIMPAFGPLAASLVQWANLKPKERVLDLGTGTGAVALAAAQVSAAVVGIDYAAAMLPHAVEQKSANQLPNVAFYQGDMHNLPHPHQSFQVALASLGLNGVVPQQVFAEVWRVLKPGGRFLFQEWGETDPASKLVKKVIGSRKVAEADGFLADLRRLGKAPKAWNALTNPEAITDVLQTAGFTKVTVRFEQETIPLEPRRFFLFRTAWAPYQAEFKAMGQTARRAVEREIVTHLTKEVGKDGCFLWQPEMMRVVAWK